MLLRRTIPLLLFISSIAATVGEDEDDWNNDGNFYASSVGDKFDVPNDDSACALWLAPSILFDGLGLYSGVDVKEGATVGQGDLKIPVYDLNMNEKSPWHDLLWPERCLSKGGVLLPGIGSMLTCKEGYGNVMAAPYETEGCLGVHRSNDPAAGSFSCKHKFEFHASRPISKGQELVLVCDSTPSSGEDVGPSPTMSFDWLREESAICLDTLMIQPSKVAPGQGAFSKAAVKAGQTVASSPVALMHRSQTEIVETFETSTDETFEQRGEEKYTENVFSHQLLLNYAYGHPDFNVLLLPYGPGVNFINHAGGKSSSKANVQIRWSTSPLSEIQVFESNAMEAMAEENVKLLVDYVALHDIEAGEEILLDYGPDWQAAWDTHVEKWFPPPDSEKYISAAEYVRVNGHRLLTDYEQRENPYPANIITSCQLDCLFPCTLLERLDEGEEQFYVVQLKDSSLAGTRDEFHRLPAKLIHLVDSYYSEDAHLSNAFRHEIGVVDTIFPQHWFARDLNPLGDFLRPTLKPGEIEPIRWAETGEVVTNNAYLVGLSPQIRIELLKYCERMGITEKLRDVTARGNPLPHDEDEEILLHGHRWYVQRPPDGWQSNIHWISPLDEEANDDYLMALSTAGFDDILSSIGTKLDLRGLVSYQVTFIGISYSRRGFVHYDMKDTAEEENRSRGFNVIIPLILANETSPELDLTTVDQETIGRLRYQYDVGVMVSDNTNCFLLLLDGSNFSTDLTGILNVKLGDDAYHASSATDYRLSKEMRMAATVYIGDIDPGNIHHIMDYYTQKYPPSDRPDLLLGMAGKHWNATNPDVKLPKPNEAFEALRASAD